MIELTFKCQCGNTVLFTLDGKTEIETPQEISKVTKFDISKHHDGCVSMGGITCNKCGEYQNF